MDKKICKFCWKGFVWRRKTQQYCSMECYKEGACLKTISKICPNCWITFQTKDKNKMYCCDDCYEHQTRTCELCGIEFVSNSHNQIVCEDCKTEWQKRWRKKPRTHICKYCGMEFEWAYKATTCPDCIKMLSSEKAYIMIANYNVLSDEEKEKINKKRSNSCKQTINNIDSDKWDEWQRKKSKSLKNYYSNMTEEEYKKYHDNLELKAEERLKNTWYKWPTQMPQVINSISSKSKAETWRKEKFKDAWYQVEEQFILGQYKYDLKIWNTLIEVNPFPFHNSTRAPPLKYAKPKNKMYHYNKTKFALNKWYNIINIWDRIWVDDVLSLLNKKSYIKESPVLHRYNPATKEHIIDNWFDKNSMNGFVEIRDWGEFYLDNIKNG